MPRPELPGQVTDAVRRSRTVPVAAVDSRTITVVVPALNEAARIVRTLTPLQALRKRGHEVIVVDGGSHDRTLELAEPLSDRTLTAPRGRACQMNAGAAVATGDILWFLHADTTPPDESDRLIRDAIVGGNTLWGRFDVRIDGDNALLALVARMMNLRSRLGGIATGDQAIFMTRGAFDRIGGFDDQPLMEDIDASRALGRLSRPACLRATVTTSARRWQSHGIVRTIITMWGMRLAYYVGVPAERLARYYRNHAA